MFDTLMYAKRLEAAGLTRDQAEAQINIIAEMVVDGVATKQDIALLRAEMGKDFAEMRIYIFQETNKNLKIMGAMSLASTTITIAVLGLLLK